MTARVNAGVIKMKKLFIILLMISIALIIVVVSTGSHQIVVGKLIIIFCSTLATTSVLKIIGTRK
ncbi:hypothetical protein ACTHP2_03995 [Bacillus altitudinis]|uniref:hypothetical protein n=1 Tax=Bacillus TaxID=1386 RepID=UPI001C3EA742|nr:hypothetical protein [Bacillus altitudinis]MDH3108351.1 hypothetical protein [Bacillus altitudinis]MEC0969763.1 hypothetical protein [Bacillus altitudinis]MEC1002770.1 hypothetical protein [Bacillus altitudinis]QXJ49018.1 hypothetical protein KIV12_04365 [Bacillus altitudinis]